MIVRSAALLAAVLAVGAAPAGASCLFPHAGWAVADGRITSVEGTSAPASGQSAVVISSDLTRAELALTGSERAQAQALYEVKLSQQRVSALMRPLRAARKRVSLTRRSRVAALRTYRRAVRRHGTHAKTTRKARVRLVRRARAHRRAKAVLRRQLTPARRRARAAARATRDQAVAVHAGRVAAADSARAEVSRLSAALRSAQTSASPSQGNGAPASVGVVLTEGLAGRTVLNGESFDHDTACQYRAATGRDLTEAEGVSFTAAITPGVHWSGEARVGARVEVIWRGIGAPSPHSLTAAQPVSVAVIY